MIRIPSCQVDDIYFHFARPAPIAGLVSSKLLKLFTLQDYLIVNQWVTCSNPVTIISLLCYVLLFTRYLIKNPINSGIEPKKVSTVPIIF
jgi:hypothetical protein